MAGGRPKVYPDRIELRVPEGWTDKLRAIAADNDRPLASELRCALGSWLDQHEPSESGTGGGLGAF